MIYLKEFDTHASYEEKLNGGVVDIKIPNVSYCNDVNDVHYNPYNTVEFYVGDITGTTPQTVKIYTSSTSVDVQVSEENKWYSYVLPKDKWLCNIESGDSVKKVVVKADISFIGESNHPGSSIIPRSTVEASFKGSDTSKVTDMGSMFFNCQQLKTLNLSGWDTSKVTSMHYMFDSCKSLTSLNLSGWDTSNVTDMSLMFDACKSLTSLDLSGWNISNGTTTLAMFTACSKLETIRMKGCLEATINKIKAQLTDDKITGVIITT